MNLRRTIPPLAAALAFSVGVGVVVAQFQRGSRGGGLFGGGDGQQYGSFIRGEDGTVINLDTVRTARETMSHSTGTPDWTNAPGFEQDVFTFARIIFNTGPGSARGFGRGWRLG